MTAAKIAALGLFALLGSLSCFGQKLIPFAEIAAGSKPYYVNQTSRQLLYAGDSSSMSPADADDPSPVSSSAAPRDFAMTDSMPSFGSTGGGGITIARTSPINKPFGKQFWLMNGLHLGMAMFDVAMTQQCISSHRCVEGNPMMPKSMAGQIGINLGVFGYSTFTSYRMKKHHSRRWWIAPTVGIASHSVGVASGFVHR